MTRKLLLFAAILVALTGCVNEISVPESKTELKFSVKYGVTEFPSAQTRATLASAFTSLCYYNYAGESLENTVIQKSTDAGFGTITDKVSPGVHDFYFVGHSSSEATFDYGTSLVSFDKVTDTFTSHISLTVDDSTVAPAITLNRCTSLIEVVATDAIPSDAATVRISVTGYPDKLNLNTGVGHSVTTSLTRDITIPSAYVGATNIPFRVYAFAPTDGFTCDVKVQVLNAAGTVMHEHILPSVPLHKNKITQYSGEVFNSDVVAGFSVSVSTDYSGTITNEF